MPAEACTVCSTTTKRTGPFHDPVQTTYDMSCCMGTKGPIELDPPGRSLGKALLVHLYFSEEKKKGLMRIVCGSLGKGASAPRAWAITSCHPLLRRSQTRGKMRRDGGFEGKVSTLGGDR